MTMSGRTTQQVAKPKSQLEAGIDERKAKPPGQGLGVIPKGELYLWDNLALRGFGSLCPFTKEVTQDNERPSPSHNSHFVPGAGHSTMNRDMGVLVVPSAAGDSAPVRPGLGQLAQLGGGPRPAPRPH